MVLVGVGIALIAYAGVVVAWRDPVTDVYARWQQRALAAQLERSHDDFKATVRPPITSGGGARALLEAAKRFEDTLEPGRPIGRIVIPSIGLDRIAVHGTRFADLARGPGHYERTSLPGLAATTAVAGHRTTFGASFRHIDELRRGDEVVMEMPYGIFRYRIFAREIVDSDDWRVIRKRGFETLVLSSCHPLYGSSQRWVVSARLVAAGSV